MSDVIEQEPETTALTVVQRAAVALNAGELEAKLRELVNSTADIIAVTNAAGRDQVHAAAMVLLKQRTGLGAVADSAVEDAKSFVKAVNEKRKALIEITSPEEARLFALRDAWDEKIKAEKVEAARIEAARQAELQALIDHMKFAPVRVVGKTPEIIAAESVDISAIEISAEKFGPRAGEAMKAKTEATNALNEMYTAAIEAAQAAALAAQKAAEEKAERARIAEANRVEAARLAALQAEIERQAQVARDEQAEKDRIAQAEREEADRKAQAERDEQDRIARENREAAQAELDAQAAELRRQQDKAEAAAQALRDQQEQAQRDADAAEQARKDAEAEAERVRQQKLDDAAQAERKEQERRMQVDFELNGPIPQEIIATLASAYNVTPEIVLSWMNRHIWADVEISV